MDSQLVEKIVHEVKSQGVFDEFRRDSMADVDTKPAYQNLRQRVERSVKKFLADQTWTPETNKNQLREKLRRHITESGFLDVGVERIVDQVVNPKIRTVFQPRIEEITYKYLGIPPPPKENKPPPPPMMHPLPPLPLKVETSNLLPNGLEQVSPDSDKGTVKSEDITVECDMDIEQEDKDEEDEEESPPFESLLEECNNAPEKCTENNKKITVKKESDNKETRASSCDTKTIDLQEKHLQIKPLQGKESAHKEIVIPLEAQAAQDSLLSNISNESFHQITKVDDKTVGNNEATVAVATISEEAQMPKFSENSNEVLSTALNTSSCSSNKVQLHFDIKKDEIKFEGTERKASKIVGEEESPTPLKETEDTEAARDNKTNCKQQTSAFKFDTYSVNKKCKSDSSDPELHGTSNTQNSLESFADDTTSRERTEVGNKSNEMAKKQNECTALSTSTLSPSSISNQTERKTEYSSKQSSSSSTSSAKHKKHSKKYKNSDKYHHSQQHHRSKDERKDSKHDRSKEKDGHHHHHHRRHDSKHDENVQTKSSTSSDHKSTRKEDNRKSSSKHGKSAGLEKKFSNHSEHSSSSSVAGVKRNRGKDDHQEIKTRLQRRKSSDSNDDDEDDNVGKSMRRGQQQPSGSDNVESSRSVKSITSTTTKTKSKTSGGTTRATTKQSTDLSDCDKISHTAPMPLNNNVVVLNDILVDPHTRCIDLNFKSSADACITINELPPPREDKANADDLICTPDEIMFFEVESEKPYTERLTVIKKALELCQETLNNFNTTHHDADLYGFNGNFANKYHKDGDLLDMERYRVAYNGNVLPKKRFKFGEYDNRHMNIIPVLSDCSVDSKENEIVDKNTNVIKIKKKSNMENRLRAVKKLTQQQRYTSDELYKPRPILSQRTRRRGMDSIT